VEEKVAVESNSNCTIYMEHITNQAIWWDHAALAGYQGLNERYFDFSKILEPFQSFEFSLLTVNLNPPKKQKVIICWLFLCLRGFWH